MESFYRLSDEREIMPDLNNDLELLDEIMTLHELSTQAETIAKTLDNAQRARNHLSVLVESWDDLSDEERKELANDTLARLGPAWPA